MKTTIEIPDALAAEAKQVARDEGSTLRDLVVTGLRAEVDRRRRRGVVDFVFPSFGGDGLLLDVAPEGMIARSYGLPE
ncbi:conserved hypothetical protein [Nostocoides australiense Ben110]|uniref:DUF2191 domain-containing protein n=1 Tax=Nostocoides australiense Ben110 TaxID=1193182 RepID=W6K4G1_9MICO|nr:DUF2191 domain-containing protein [Tetrasphaera australiensis]CCH74954.1 conserved hypothetical protein [Tetrasphaera australiensis Ben110]HRW01156.1 DUF2191 domain-containing protein [Tetrasphaera sp.]